MSVKNPARSRPLSRNVKRLMRMARESPLNPDVEKISREFTERDLAYCDMQGSIFMAAVDRALCSCVAEASARVMWSFCSSSDSVCRSSSLAFIMLLSPLYSSIDSGDSTKSDTLILLIHFAQMAGNILRRGAGLHAPCPVAADGAG